MARTGQKTAFVLAGGGSLGAMQVGMLDVLLAAGLQPDFVVGTSVGAINAGYFAGGPNAEGVARLAKIWFDLRRGDVNGGFVNGLVPVCLKRSSCRQS